MKTQEDALILRNERLVGDYFRVDFKAETIVPQVEPGQFVHAKFSMFEHRLLRRPFSICDVDLDTGVLTVVYKVIGEGTAHLSRLQAGETVNLLGPLGKGFSLPGADSSPIIVAGGYGCAATLLLAKRSPVPCRCLLGGRTREDLLLVDEFRQLGCQVELATDDGSCGIKGLVTELLEQAIAEAAAPPAIYACGPNPMLRAVSNIVLAKGLDAEISLDQAMGCGVGACYACVVKMKADNPDGWEYVRTCVDGPVFKASAAHW
jgi:dihydroorotate dehydrogenase electron transfer subunit